MKELSIGKYISSIYRHQGIIINQLFTEFNFGSGQYLFLIKISEHEGINQKDLSEMIHIDRANTNRAIKKLEQLELIYTTEDSNDRRNRKNFLTEEGKSVVAVVRKRLKKVSEVLLKDFTESEQLSIANCLEKMESNVQEEVRRSKGENR